MQFDKGIPKFIVCGSICCLGFKVIRTNHNSNWSFVCLTVETSLLNKVYYILIQLRVVLSFCKKTLIMCECVNELLWHYVLLVAVFNCLSMTAVMCCDWQAIECCLALTRRLSLQKNTSVWLESELQKWTEHSCLRFNIKHSCVL